MSQLQTIITEQGLDQDKAKAIVEAFGGPFEEAGKVLATYQSIKVTDESQVAEMKQARTARLTLKNARVTVENNRKALKEDIVKQGRAIDSAARFVKEAIKPAEEYLEQQEKFAEIKKAERAAKLKAERIEKLSQYTDNLTPYNLDGMSDGDFDSLLNQLEEAHEAKLAKEQSEREEAERRVRERLAEEKRIREENERLQKEAQAERQKREELERAERERKEVEAQAKAAAEKAEHDALMAPDKEKLQRFAQVLAFVAVEKKPQVNSDKARAVLSRAVTQLAMLQQQIEEEANKL